MKVVYCDEGFWVDTDRLEEIDGEMVAPEICEDDINDEIERLQSSLKDSQGESERLAAELERLSEQLARMEPDFVAKNEYAAAIFEELTETACAKGYCDIVECVNESPVRVERAEVFQRRTDNDKGEPSALGAPRPTSKSAARRALDGEEVSDE